MDPLFAQNGRLTAKSDVYSFGVVLLELITRKRARTEDGEIGLVGSFIQSLSKGFRRVREMFDPEIATLRGMKTIEEIARLAGKCLRMEHDKRPEMLEVAERLRKLRKALHQVQERLALFSWVRKNKQAPVETPSLESSSGSRNVGTFIVRPTVTDQLFELEDLCRAPSEVLGRGTVGTTFKAKLDGGYELAVKKLTGVNLSKAEFEQRVMLIAAVQNKHILPLRGYYCGKDETWLAYDIIPMGNLSKALHGGRVSSPARLDLEQRSTISLAVARGVAAIHLAGPLSCHGNIKSSNILLTGTHDACVSEYGLIPQMDMYFRFPRISCYRAPELTDNKWASQKADVYSFGVLLLELLTRKPPAIIRMVEGINLPVWVCSVIHEKWTAEVFDMELLAREKDGKEESMARLLQLALDCCSQDADLRPAMSDVVQEIEAIHTVLTPDQKPHT